MISNSAFSAYLYCSGLLGEETLLEDHAVFAVKAEACLIKLYNNVTEMTGNETEEEIQSIFYEAGKLEFKDNLRLWFQIIYWVMFKETQGPRLGTFVKLVGVDHVLDKIHKALHSPF